MAASLQSIRALLRALSSASSPYHARATNIGHRLWIGPIPERRDTDDLVAMRPVLLIDCSETPTFRSPDELSARMQTLRCSLDRRASADANRMETAACLRAGADAIGAKSAVIVCSDDDALYRAPSVAYGILRMRGMSMLEATRAVAKRYAALPYFLEHIESVVMREQPASRWNP